MAQPGTRPVRPIHTGIVTAKEQLTPSMVRITVRSDAVTAGDFVPNGFSDAYFKLVLTDHDGAEVMRTYTVRRWLVEQSSFEADFMVHGDEGLAGPWARDAQVGAEVAFRGPGGEYAAKEEAQHHLLVGDLSALPAIEATLAELPEGAAGHVLIVHDDPADQRELATNLPVRWVINSDLAAAHEETIAAVVALPEMPELQAFVHGEAGFVRKLRRHLRVDRSVRPGWLSISGYWKWGRTDEVWRTEKKAWAQPVDDREAQLG